VQAAGTIKSAMGRVAFAIGLVICLIWSIEARAASADIVTDMSLVKNEFISQSFGVAEPSEKTVWIKGDRRKTVNRILGHSKYPGLRVRYWQSGQKTVWVLEEIGKYKPITTGIVIEDGVVAKVEVLAYRESHGWEVKHDFFTRQFIGASLKPKRKKLSQEIDGISGATLSVRALKNLTRMALYLDGEVRAAE